MSEAQAQRTYLPAAGRDWALPLYDPLVKLLGLNATRRVLIEQAGVRPGQRVLEIGCGTGTLVVHLKRLRPDTDVTGLEPDPKALARARRKAERARTSVALDRGFSDELPYPDDSFDRVLSSFMFHHLPRGVKDRTLREVARVLRPGGGLHMVDFAAAGRSRSDGPIARALHSSPNLDDNAEERVLALMRQAGLVEPRVVGRATALFGHLRLNYYQASTR